MMKQYFFFFDSDRCIQCRTCEITCKSIHNIEHGLKWRSVIDIWSGEFPDVTRTFISMSCLHCAEPACKEACPTEAIIKNDENGIVLVDKDKCTGCRDCYTACPYRVPQFDADGYMQKCNFCIDRKIEPACAANCPTESLHYGTINDLPRFSSGKVIISLDGETNPSMIIVNKQGTTIIASDLMI